MIGSAQKAPVTSAALTALNLAVVRQVVFEHAAEQISERRKDATEAVVQTAEEGRNRNAVVDAVVEGKAAKQAENEASFDSSKDADRGADFESPEFSGGIGTNLDIQV